MHKVMLVTGASSGIGREVAILLAREGHSVYAGARRLDRMQDLAEHGITPVEMDVTRGDDNERAVSRIINVSSMLGRVFVPLGAWYHATKHALEGWSDCLRFETAPFNIQVVLIEPGAIKTEFADVMRAQFRKYCGDTAYKAQVDRFLKRMDDPRLMERATEAEVFAKVFLEAATTRKPRRRYARGSMARPVMFLRKWFGDGVYEFVLRRAFR
ncbi:SDR family NAD(P)-dependent oxidoreductase [Candidatus Palauibacter sp.]|uniref:SDR family NAD(P)-dependent oxidoreductase n=1 Tax=Candidatus Palauibacter sp. TaxID=3101350 RepID=UPI003B016316